MFEMSEYSAVAAVHTLWLAARLRASAWDGSPSLILKGIAAVLEVPPDWLRL
jgi:hypothetical protein